MDTDLDSMIEERRGQAFDKNISRKAVIVAQGLGTSRHRGDESDEIIEHEFTQGLLHIFHHNEEILTSGMNGVVN